MASVMQTACEMTEMQERMEQEARGVKAKTIVRGTPYELAGTGDGYWRWVLGMVAGTREGGW